MGSNCPTFSVTLPTVAVVALLLSFFEPPQVIFAAPFHDGENNSPSLRHWFLDRLSEMEDSRRKVENMLHEVCRRVMAASSSKAKQRTSGDGEGIASPMGNRPVVGPRNKRGLLHLEEHPARLLISHATSRGGSAEADGVRARPRVARSCTVVTTTGSSSADAVPGIERQPLCPSESKLQLELRDRGKVSEVVENEETCGVTECSQDYEGSSGVWSGSLDRKPFVGMVLQVLSVSAADIVGVHVDDDELVELDLDLDDDSNLKRKGLELEDPRKPCVMHKELVAAGGSAGSDDEAMVQYELVERLHTELGLVDVHSLDYAYRPVFTVPHGEGSDQWWKVQEKYPAPSRPMEGPNKLLDWEKRLPIGNTQGSSAMSDGVTYLRPILHFMGFGRKERKRDGEGTTESLYEKMGDQAFAGGSHGEVWRARRRCDPIFSPAESKTGECDDQQELIMKRLKVEHGHDLLEAGLREVYFGDLLARETAAVGAKHLFTTYVDHFFREGPVAPSLRGSLSEDNAELWIVFENAGSSLRSYIYEAVASEGFLVYQHSSFWRRLRNSVARDGGKKAGGSSQVAIVTDKMQTLSPSSSIDHVHNTSTEEQRQKHSEGSNSTASTGRILMREVLRQVLTSAAFLHERGIVHRDIKPSNIMCTAVEAGTPDDTSKLPFECVLGDFSSAWDEFTSQNLYVKGPSAAEQTDEYAPPEVLFGPTWIPFHLEKPQSYDSWSIGVVALELLLGTPNVFSVDQRTTVILSNKMRKEGAAPEEIRRALYLAALSQFCIYVPTAAAGRSWPLRTGDPLQNAAMVKPTCTLHDFHSALRARDPLGIGFDSSSDTLLQLIWGLLAWDPMKRITPSEALNHEYFNPPSSSESSGLQPGRHNALESQTLDPRRDMMASNAAISEFVCPKCQKKFNDLNSCQRHATSRQHAKFCTYDRSLLPNCLNAHSMLPAHPTSGYCDIQGRRPTIEDFHSIHLHSTHQFYGVFDGHTGNLASKYAASLLYKQLVKRLSDLDRAVEEHENWKAEVKQEMTGAFNDLHKDFLEAVMLSPGGVMDQSGTTATVLYVTSKAVIVANIGDSRAVLSKGASYYPSSQQATAIELTIDHVASDRREQKLVEQRGGFISSAGGIDRVNGVLAVTRSIGDADLAPFLSRYPHVIAMSREEVKKHCRQSTADIEGDGSEFPCFVVLASDGLWDVMNNQEAVDMVIQVIRRFDTDSETSWEEGGAFQEAAKVLTQEAYVRGSKDNIGVCVVAID